MGYTIKDLETISGIKAHTIRIWERRYHFLKPERTDTNIRTYSDDELKTLLTVALLNKYGYKVSQIDTMPPERRVEEALRLPQGEAQEEAAVNQLITCMVDMDTAGFERILSERIQEQGLESAIRTIVFLFLEKTGILWHTARIHPAHEHIVSNIIRQKLLAAIDALPVPERKAPLLLMLLPEKVHHELGLLLVHYLVKQKGLSLIYMGADVPLSDARYVMETKQPQYLYIHLTAIGSKEATIKYLQGLSCKAPCPILLSGSSAAELKEHLPASVIPFDSLTAVQQFIDGLPVIG